MKLNPYILFNGNAEEALNFYKEVLGGEISQLGRYGESPMPCDDAEKHLIMHARLEFEGNLVMISDSSQGRTVGEGDNVQLSVDVESMERINDVFAKMSDGGVVMMELQDMFWGARFGILKDKFGIRWMFNHELKK